MENAVLLFIVLFTLCSLFIGSRLFMFRVLEQFSYERGFMFRKVTQGVVQDMACAVWLLVVHTLFANTVGAYAAQLTSALLVTLGLDALVFLNIFDAVYFSQTNTRIDRSLTANINRTAIRAMFKAQEMTAALGALLILALLSFLCLQSLVPITPPVTGVILVGLAALTATGVVMHHKMDPKELPKCSHAADNDWIRTKIQSGMQMCANAIARGVLTSLYTNLVRPEHAFYKNSDDLTPEEITMLVEKMQLKLPDVSNRASAPSPYKRVIIVAMESLARDYISFYNPRVPQTATRFLNYAAQRYPNLRNFYSSGYNTEPGLMALVGSRLLNTWEANGTSQDTIFSLLRERNFTTSYLLASPGRYNNYTQKLPHIFKMEHLIGAEILDKEFPDAVRNEWGVSDAYLYEKAIRILHEAQDKPVCLLISTINTHAPYWYSYTDFPPDIAAKKFRIYRSLYQADTELKEFYHKLTAARLFDDETLLVITADHTSNAGKQYQMVTGVTDYSPGPLPCIFMTKNTAPLQGMNAGRICSQLDFLPTFCDIMGIPAPRTALGRSLFTPTDHPFAMQYDTPNSICILWPDKTARFNCTQKAIPDTYESVMQKWLSLHMSSAGAL